MTDATTDSPATAFLKKLVSKIEEGRIEITTDSGQSFAIDVTASNAASFVQELDTRLRLGDIEVTWLNTGYKLTGDGKNVIMQTSERPVFVGSVMKGLEHLEQERATKIGSDNIKPRL